MSPTHQPDFTLLNAGSVVLLTPHTDAARQWADEHLPADAVRYAGGIAIEPRYVPPILDGIDDAGLEVA